MFAKDEKTQKIEPGLFLFFLGRTKVSEAVGKCYWHNVRSFLVFNMRKVRMRISDIVCKNL